MRRRIPGREHPAATALLAAGLVLAALAAGCSRQPATARASVGSCTQFGIAAIRHHVTVTADIRRGERFIADTYHALAGAGYLDSTVLVITFDEWGGFFDHVRPPQVIDDTNPATVDHTGNSTTPTDGRLVPDYTQLGFRVPAIVVSNLAAARVAHDGPFEHTSSLKLIESTFGLQPLTARDTNAMDLRQVLNRKVRQPVPESAIPTSSQVPGPTSDAAAFCSAASVQSTSPSPVSRGEKGADRRVLPRSGYPAGTGMAGLARQHRRATTR